VRRYNIGRSAFHHLFMKAKNMMEAKILRWHSFWLSFVHHTFDEKVSWWK
jgi:hypothetical protein